jgi:uncharacterized membrane protein
VGARYSRIDIVRSECDARLHDERIVQMSLGAAIVVGAVAGLVVGVLVGLATDVPLAPEVGVALGALVGWLSRRRSG